MKFINKNILLGLFVILCLTFSFCTTTDPAHLININSVNYLPNTIYPGDVVSLAINIEDIGTINYIKDLTVSYELDDAFTNVENSYFIDEIKPKMQKTAILKFKVNENTIAGYYPILLNFDYYRNGNKINETQELTIPITKTSKNILLTVSPKKINPGKESELQLTLTNSNNSTISNIEVSWYEENNLILPLGSDNIKSIKSIEGNTFETVYYNVATDPNLSPGIYTLKTTIKFNDSNGIKTQTSNIGIIIGGETDFDVSVEYEGNNEYSFSIANIGTNDAESTLIEIPEQTGIKTIGTNQAILGGIDRGDYTMATFTIINSNMTMQKIDPNNISKDENFRKLENKNNDLNIILYYTDTTGKRQTITKTVNLNNNTLTSNTNLKPQKNNNNWLFVIIGIIIIIFTSVIFTKREYIKTLIIKFKKRGFK